MKTNDRVAFNINAELYEDRFGDLAVKLPGERVYRNVGMESGERFQVDVVGALEEGKMPSGWAEMPAHELTGRGWRRIARLGYLDGDPQRPAVEFEAGAQGLGDRAREYLADAGGG